MTNPFHDLWCAVLLQAIEDALYGSRPYHKRSDEREAGKKRARNYFAKPNGDLLTVCNLAGVDPAATRERVVTQIKAAAERERAGVVLDFVPSNGTGGGSSEQESPDIIFHDRSLVHA